MKSTQKTSMNKITQALLLATALIGISTSAMANSNQVSVTVKKIEGTVSQVMHSPLKRSQASAIWSITQVEPVRSKVKP